MPCDKSKYEALLCDLPVFWRQDIINLLCAIIEERDAMSCEEAKACQSLTNIPKFELKGTTFNFTYKDENGALNPYSLDFNHMLDTLDPGCLTSPNIWAGLSLVGRLQLLINKACAQPEVPTTTTTTTTLPPTTTTTTTLSDILCPAITGMTFSFVNSHPRAFFGWKATPEALTESAILQSPLYYDFATGAEVIADFRNNTTPAYLWMAEPLSEPLKTTWYCTLLNNGTIGAGSVWTNPVTVGEYRYYTTSYQTQQTQNTVHFTTPV